MDYEYFLNHNKVFAIDVSKQIELENSDFTQQTNFIGKLEDDEGKMIFIIENLEEKNFNFHKIL